MKTLYIFSKESFSYISENGNPKKIPYISGNRNPKKTFYISGNKFPRSNNEKTPLLKSFLYFWKWNFLASSLKNFLIFQEVTCKA